MALAALVVAVVAALAAVGSFWYARRLDERAKAAVLAAGKSAAAAERSADASEVRAVLEGERRHAERTPQFRVTVEGANPGVDDLTLTVFLAGPAELGRLDGLSVRIRDDYPGRAEGIRIAGGPTPEQVAAQIWGPYKFAPGSGPGGQLADPTGRATPTSGMPVGESLVFILTPTVLPSWSGSPGWWARKMAGTAVRLQLECSRGGESWSLPAEVDVASLPVTVEVP